MPDPGAAPASNRRRHLAGWLAGAAALGVAPLPAAAQGGGGAPSGPRRPPRYAQPDAKAPRTLVSAASRSAGSGGGTVGVLAPQRTGFAVTPRPTLYGFAGGPTPSGALVELSIIEERDAVTEPLFERDVTAEAAGGGIVGFALPPGVTLRPGVDYRWALRVAVDRASPSGDALSSGTIRVVPPPAGVPPARPAPSLDRAERLAAAGVWYDCLMELSAWVAQRPSDRGRREARAGLLEQEGHAAAAAWDRAQGG